MSRGAWFRLLLVLGLLAGCAWISIEREPRLGLDLRGGTQLVLQAEDTERAEANAENVDKAIEVLRGRVDALGVAEPTLTRAGEDRIIVELPDVDDPRQAREALGRTAQLSIHPVVRSVPNEKAKPQNPKDQILPSDSGDVIEIGPAALTGDDITGADAVTDPSRGTEWVVTVDFSGEGSDAFGKISGEAACAQGAARRIAIVLDGEVISSPEVQVPCGSSIRNTTEISGGFSAEEAKNLAILIEGGALPLTVSVIESRIVGPTLGEAAIEASWQAAVIGLALTLLFIAVVYRLVGFLATLALTSYALLSYAILVALGSTLTLPGLAGFVLAIGLAIDANVLVFERAREEYRDAPKAGLTAALKIGFNKAWTAIIDSNVTTLLAAALLFFLGSGPIKGFGVTLSIGVLASMISALIIARVLTEIGVSIKAVRKRPKISGIANVGRARVWLENKNPQIMTRRNLWLGFSGVLVVIALTGIFVKGINLGVEFTGGRSMDFSTGQQVSADEAREAVSDAGFPEATVQATEDEITVRLGQISDTEAIEIEEALAEVAGGDVTKEEDVTIGASFGDELRDKALLAFGIAFLAQLLYLALRFKWNFGLSAVIAMFHDVLLVVGLFAWLEKPIDGVFLAAAMTIIGLSVNDTVVVFDRIRERWRATKDSFMDVANKACLETMPRTINTGLGAMFILAALAILGGDSLQDFAIALLVGLIVGTWSSVFTATPLLTYLHEKSPMSREVKVKKARDPQDTGAVV